MDVKKPTPNTAFMSSNSRFAPPRDIMLNETDFLNPGGWVMRVLLIYHTGTFKVNQGNECSSYSSSGPGEYDPDVITRVGNHPHGLLCSREQRFKLVSKSGLGPGSYQVWVELSAWDISVYWHDCIQCKLCIKC